MSPMVAHNEKKTSQGKRRQSLREESRQKIKTTKKMGGKFHFVFLDRIMKCYYVICFGKTLAQRLHTEALEEH